MNTHKNPSSALRIITIVLILDFLGLGLILPVLNNYFKDHNANLFSPETTDQLRNTMYLISYGLFFLGTFFGAPVVGSLCDKLGRRKMILFTAICTMLSTTIVFIGIRWHQIYLIYAGRLFAGLFSGMLIVLQSSIADISDHSNKAKNFGVVGIAFGIGFSLGPIIGSIISDYHWHPRFNYALPYAVATIINLANVIFIYFFYKETLTAFNTAPIYLSKAFQNIHSAFSNSSLRIVFVVIFILATGFSLYLQNFQSLLIDLYSLSKIQIGLSLLYVGFWIALAQGFILRYWLKFAKPIQILKWSIPLMGLSFLALGVAKSIYMYYLIIPFLCISQGCTFPNLLSILSGHTSAEKQGEVLSINQSVQSLASSMPLLLAYPAGKYTYFAILFGASCAFLAYLLFRNVYTQKVNDIEAS